MWGAHRLTWWAHLSPVGRRSSGFQLPALQLVGMCPFPAAAAILAFGVLTVRPANLRCFGWNRSGSSCASACFPTAGGWEHPSTGRWSGTAWRAGTAACTCSFVTQLWHAAQQQTPSGEVKPFLSPNKPLAKWVSFFFSFCAASGCFQQFALVPAYCWSKMPQNRILSVGKIMGKIVKVQLMKSLFCSLSYPSVISLWFQSVHRVVPTTVSKQQRISLWRITLHFQVMEIVRMKWVQCIWCCNTTDFEKKCVLFWKSWSKSCLSVSMQSNLN